jgi:hypothetical protein
VAFAFLIGAAAFELRSPAQNKSFGATSAATDQRPRDCASPAKESPSNEHSNAGANTGTSGDALDVRGAAPGECHPRNDKK